MMTIEQRIGRMFLVGFEGLSAPDYILEWLAEGRIGGVILFARNIGTPEQTAAMIESCHTAAKHPILVSIDQEGGTVARMREGYSESPGAMALSAAGNGAVLSEKMSRVLADEMRALGINWVYAPVVDITYNRDNPTVGTRSYGSDAERIAEMAGAAVRGFQAGGVAACAKHFPGLGNTAIDTHLALAVLDDPVEKLLTRDLIPYQELIRSGIMSIMTTHTVYKALDPELPATLSPVLVKRLLREKLGFAGVVTSDCMEMKAIADNWGPGESAVLAALAGLDVILVSHTRSMQEKAYEALMAAVKSGRVSESIIGEANARIERLHAQLAQAEKPPVSVIRSEAHQQIALEAARAGVVTLRSATEILPVKPDQRVGLIEFASILDSEVMERGEIAGFARHLHAAAPWIEHIALRSVGEKQEKKERAAALAESADTLIIATRNAHLIPEQAAAAKAYLHKAKRTVLICLRNPWDATELPEAQVALCTCGDSAPSLQAGAEALLGLFTPTGHLPLAVL